MIGFDQVIFYRILYYMSGFMVTIRENGIGELSSNSV